MYDVIVVGVGTMGSATCYALAKQGLKVLGIEQFDVVHELGSHSGQSRLIRKAYFEHPDYVPLLHSAYDRWSQIESESATQIYWQTGIAYFAPKDIELMKGVKNSASKYHLKLDKLDAERVEERWPQFSIPEKFECLFEPEAGFVLPEVAIKTMVSIAERYGAEIKTRETVLSFHNEDYGIQVITNTGSYQAKRVVVTAGAYTSKLFDFPISLRVTRQLLAWAKPKTTTNVGLGELPCWMIANDDISGLYYGFPRLDKGFEGPKGMKIAYHRPGETMEDVESPSFDPADEWSLLQNVLNMYLPNTGAQITEFKQCRYTYSSDEHFILDFAPRFSNRILFAAGFSGHGFKFAPVIGDALADIVINGKTSLPVGFLKLSRFG